MDIKLKNKHDLIMFFYVLLTINDLHDLQMFWQKW